MSFLSSTTSTARQIRLGLVLLGFLAGLFPAHATYPGENGPIVFTFGTPRAIGKVKPGNAGITTLTDGFSPRVSPNGRKIAFLKGSLNLGKDVYTMDMDGTNLVQLTNDARSYAVAWAPDGSRLAYVTETVTPRYARSLWTMRSDGTDKTLLRELPDAIQWYSLDWSPTSNTLVYTRPGNSILLEDLGSSSTRLLKADAEHPSWAPDGKSIVYRQAIIGQGMLREINPDGTNDHALSTGEVHGRTVVSPDGRQLVGSLRTSSTPVLTSRPRAGLPASFTWPVSSEDVEWARVPRNCFSTTLSGGGGVLADDLAFYAEECAIAASPNTTNPTSVLAQALAVGPDGRVYARSLKTPQGGGAAAWGPATVVPGEGRSPDGIKALKLAITAAWDGSYQVAIVNAADQSLYHAILNSQGVWSGFTRLDGWGGLPNFPARDVAIAMNGNTATTPGQLVLLATGLKHGEVFERVRRSDGSWRPFNLVPGGISLNARALAMASSNDAYTNVLAITTSADGSRSQVQQAIRDQSGNWGSWVTVPTPTNVPLWASSDVAVARAPLSGGPANVLILDAEGQTWLQSRNNPQLVASWQGEVPTERITTGGRSVSLSSTGQATRILVTRVYPQ